MGVYILKMEKPTDCDYCDFYRWGYCHVKHARVECEDGVDDDCPLISVAEPHGRLIEVTNKLRQELCWYEAYTGIDEAPVEYATSVIDDAPTVIEAEGE